MESNATETTEASASSWQRTLWVMAAVQLIMAMAFSSMTPFLPLYIEELGVKNPHSVDVWSGLISSANFLVSAIVSPLWGAIADRKGRKIMVMRTTLAISLFTCMMGLAHHVWELLLIRILQGAFSGFSASATALVATVTPEKKLGYALGWLQSAGFIGILIGPSLGGFAADQVHSYRLVFFITAVFAMTAFLVATFFVKENFKPGAASKRKPNLIEQFKAVGALKEVRVMFVVLFIAQFTTMTVQPVISLFMEQLTGNVSYLGTIAGIAFSMTGLADFIASPFLGKRSDTLGYRKVLTICMIGAGLFYLPQAFAPNIWVFIASRFGLGLFVGGIIPTANALIGRLTPPEQRGQVFGFTASATFLGSFAGPLFGGTGSALFGIRTMLGLCFFLYMANMLWVRLRVKEPQAVGK